MNIFKIFGDRKSKALEAFDKTVVEQLRGDEAQKQRDIIAAQFDELLSSMQVYEDTCKELEHDLKRDAEILKVLCKGGA